MGLQRKTGRVRPKVFMRLLFSQRRRETLVAPLQRRVSLILVTSTQVQPVSLQTRSSLAPGGL